MSLTGYRHCFPAQREQAAGHGYGTVAGRAREPVLAAGALTVRLVVLSAGCAAHVHPDLTGADLLSVSVQKVNCAMCPCRFLRGTKSRLPLPKEVTQRSFRSGSRCAWSPCVRAPVVGSYTQVWCGTVHAGEVPLDPNSLKEENKTGSASKFLEDGAQHLPAARDLPACRIKISHCSYVTEHLNQQHPYCWPLVFAENAMKQLKNSKKIDDVQVPCLHCLGHHHMPRGQGHLVAAWRSYIFMPLATHHQLQPPRRCLATHQDGLLPLGSLQT